jgi:hypothetical protein
MLSSFTAKSNEEAIKLTANALANLEESEYKIDGPEDFDCFIMHKVHNGLKVITRTMHEAPSEEIKDKSKADFIFINYGFLERNIRELCKLREGSSCCADKSRYILKMYLKYSIDGEIPEFNANVEHYWIPNFGDNQMWIKYCDSLYRLYYGDAKEYFMAYNSLIQCKIRKFKHILHKWFIEYTNGEITQFATSWDERTENPLKLYQVGDYYIINKKYTGSIETEPYNPVDEEFKFLYRNCVKVHKDKVAHIYYENEEKLC